MSAGSHATNESHSPAGAESAVGAAIDDLRVEVVRRGGTCTGRLSSGSMSPTIAVLDEAVVGPLGTPKPGFVVLFRRDGRLTVHRLIGRGRTSGLWREAGDGNAFGGQIDEQELLGEVIEVRKAGGAVSLASTRARYTGRAIAALRRLEFRLAPGGGLSPLPGSALALRLVRRAADVLIRGAARPREGR